MALRSATLMIPLLSLQLQSVAGCAFSSLETTTMSTIPETMQAVVVNAHGGPEALSYETVPVPSPGEGQILVKNHFVGVNFIDTYHRSGLYAVPLPYMLGREGAGDVVALGQGVDVSLEGARVAYVLTPGAYAEYTVVQVGRHAVLPESVGYDVGASIMLQGLTAHYLCTGSYPVSEGDTVLVHAASGGTGLLLSQLCKHYGARVIGTVSSEAKAELARTIGKVDEVILYTSENFTERTLELTDGKGVAAVFDGVGASTFDGSCAALAKRGTMVSFGNASGAVPPVNILASLKGSKYLIRPSLGDYMDTFEERTAELMSLLANGSLTVHINQATEAQAAFPLADAQAAHEALEGRATSGKVLLKP